MRTTILVVDDDPGQIQLLGRALDGLGTLRFATNGTDAVQMARDHLPDLVLLDAQMPGMSGFKVFEELKALPQLNQVPIIFVTSHGEAHFEISSLEMGAVDFIAKPINPALVAARVKTQLRLRQMSDSLRHAAINDPLTGVANRRRFDEVLSQEWLRARRHGSPLALLLIDPDEFKLYNQRFGRAKGDECLKQVAETLQRGAGRAVDLVARCGGAEFAIVLPHTPRQGAMHSALQLREAIAGLKIAHAASSTGPLLTASIGVSCYDEDSGCFSRPPADVHFGDESHAPCTEFELLLAADKALYSSKRSGKAQVKFLDIGDVDRPELIREVPLRAQPVRGRCPHHQHAVS